MDEYYESNILGQLEMYDEGIWKGVCPLGTGHGVNVPLKRVACRQKGMKGKSTNLLFLWYMHLMERVGC